MDMHDILPPMPIVLRTSERRFGLLDIDREVAVAMLVCARNPAVARMVYSKMESCPETRLLARRSETLCDFFSHCLFDEQGWAEFSREYLDLLVVCCTKAMTPARLRGVSDFCSPLFDVDGVADAGVLRRGLYGLQRVFADSDAAIHEFIQGLLSAAYAMHVKGQTIFIGERLKWALVVSFQIRERVMWGAITKDTGSVDTDQYRCESHGLISNFPSPKDCPDWIQPFIKVMQHMLFVGAAPRNYVSDEALDVLIEGKARCLWCMNV